MGAFSEILWLLGDTWQAGRHREVALGMARVLLPAARLVGVCMAFRGSLHALLVSGPFLRSIADLVLDRRAAGRRGPGTPCRVRLTAGLAGAARIRDLPLILFLSRTVLRLEAKPLLRAAKTGVGREALVGEMERQVRDRSAGPFGGLRAPSGSGWPSPWRSPSRGWALR